MTLEEAIERLTQRVDGEFWCGDPECVDDLKLSIEALRKTQKDRKAATEAPEELLPGETW